MPELVKTPLAEADLKNIWHYTFDMWGADKATDYLLKLDAAMQILLDHPQMGQSRDHIRQGYRAIQINRHVIYYRLQRNTVDIVRVLHERMNPETHL